MSHFWSVFLMGWNVKDPLEIQRTWRDWLDQYAVTQSWTPAFKATFGVEMAKEVDWAIRTPDLTDSLTRRIAKVASQMETYEGDLSQFDVYWQHRYAFLEWMDA